MLPQFHHSGFSSILATISMSAVGQEGRFESLGRCEEGWRNELQPSAPKALRKKNIRPNLYLSVHWFYCFLEIGLSYTLPWAVRTIHNNLWYPWCLLGHPVSLDVNVRQ